MDTPVPEIDAQGRPLLFKMEIQGSLLEALGVNLYSSIGKCLVEFAANAFDSDSPAIDITIPFDGIKRERELVRAKAKERAKADTTKRKVLVVLDPLPPEITIVISDTGHGMRAQEIQEKFLPLNRNRRQGSTEAESDRLGLTESGKRRVMGRKGLGKLAAFGVAQQVTIYSKRAGDAYATEFTMDFDRIRESPRLQEVPFTPKYLEGVDTASHGTRITLSRLRCDAVATGEAGVASVIRDNFFGIEATEFAIKINGTDLGSEKANYEYVFPEERPFDDMSESVIEVPDGLGSFRVTHRAMFRAREDGKRNHLPGAKRGARFYCNGRLAAGPSLLDLHSGVHNFGATAYLEVLVRADEIDALGVDLINTNRTDFRRDNDVVNELLFRVTAFMQEALKGYSKFRDDETERLLVESDIGKSLEAQIDQLPKRTRVPARKLIRLLARHDGVDSESFKATAPLIVQSVNSGEVLVKLLELSQRDTNLKEVIVELQRLAEIENSDALKVYRARKNALVALQGLIKQGDDTWKQNPQFEADLHSLLDGSPWLIREEIGRYVSSDKPLATTLKRVEAELKINGSAVVPMDPQTRPDQVFLLGDSSDLNTVIVVELKSPNIPLNSDHWLQLEKYINEAEVFLGTEKRNVRVRGYLIGTPPPRNTRNSSESLLLKWWDTPNYGQIEILSPTMLLQNAVERNKAQIEILDAADAES